MHLFALMLALGTVHVPPVVRAHLSDLVPVARFQELPAPISAGQFAVGGISAKGWRMAEPGGAFNATDTPVTDAPGRRLIVAACDRTFCLIHYELGGIAHVYEVPALALHEGAWEAVWSVYGPASLGGIDGLERFVRSPASFPAWHGQGSSPYF